ncbi:hypothetical protein [Streptomyces sp. NPDC101115]|uniref:hypothetical protein n=1 Tax=Streptomyces sp. NPDC101115 TaxID=3366106 RepID=UPI0037FD9396
MTSPEDPDAGAGARGDDVYQPVGSDAPNRPSGPLDPENMLDAEPAEGPEEPGFSPPDRPSVVTAVARRPRSSAKAGPWTTASRRSGPT